MLTVNAVLFFAIGISVVVWLLQEYLGRTARVQQVVERNAGVVSLGADAGFPTWLRVAGSVLVLAWCALFVTVYLKRDGDFAVVLVSLVLFSGVVCLLDRVLLIL